MPNAKKSRRAKSPISRRRQASQIEPLPATFTLVSIFGLVVTTVFTASGRVPLSWGVAFDLVFAAMFVASMISISPRFAGYD